MNPDRFRKLALPLVLLVLAGCAQPVPKYVHDYECRKAPDRLDGNNWLAGSTTLWLDTGRGVEYGLYRKWDSQDVAVAMSVTRGTTLRLLTGDFIVIDADDPARPEYNVRALEPWRWVYKGFGRGFSYEEVVEFATSSAAPQAFGAQAELNFYVPVPASLLPDRPDVDRPEQPHFALRFPEAEINGESYQFPVVECIYRYNRTAAVFQ